MSNEREILLHIFNPNFKFPGRVFRPEQRALAIAMIDHFETTWSHTKNAPVGIGEAGAGIGKTLVELIFAMTIAYCSKGPYRRSVISTYSVALRSQLFDEEHCARSMLQQACEELKLPLPKKIIVAELFSLAQFISPYEVDKYAKHVTQSAARYPQEIIEYWSDFAKFMVARSENGTVPVKFDEWIEESDGKGLPLGLGQMDLAITEHPDDKIIRDILVEAKQHAQEADIVIVTHMMGLFLNTQLHFQDSLEKSGRTISNDKGPFEVLVVDECQKLPTVARSQVEDIISFKLTREILSSLPNGLLSSEAERSLDDLGIWLETITKDRNVVEIKSSSLMAQLLEVIRPFHKYTREVLLDENFYESEPFLVSQVEKILLFYTEIIDLYDQAGAASQVVNALSDLYPLVQKRGTDITIRLSSGDVGFRLGLLWRRSQQALMKRTFKSVIMISGTITDGIVDRGDPYKTFRREVGAHYLLGPKQDVRNLTLPIAATNTGHISRLVVVSRDKSFIPSLDVSDNTGDYTNPSHSNLIRDSLIYIVTNLPKGRIMAIFQSENAMRKVHQLLVKSKATFLNRIIVQAKGQKFTSGPLEAFRADSQAILFTLNKEGINPVDETGKSLIDHLVVTKLPIAPPDQRRLSDPRFSSGFRWEFTEANWSLRQCIARALRDSTARPTCWILDAHLPMPSEMDPVKYGEPRFVEVRHAYINNLYRLFESTISLRLFGQRVGIMRKPVEIAILRRDSNQKLILKSHHVVLRPKYEDELIRDTVKG